ncbi:MAG TPA: formimidoylglutamase [Bacteroidales bacterium]|nr:formimidoylglutamase [Bacteroidales bacterium]HOR81373.1 formimidoylglutamase [Bacteroidales bacterium]HPJ90851.1 formimidoylglutamase [Bacteroidales bacterium]
MELQDYFHPLCIEELDFFSLEQTSHLMGDNIYIHTEENPFPTISNFKIVLLGVPEEKNAYNNIGCSEGPDEIRKQLYQLYCHNNMPPITDLGNLKVGKTANDTYIALTDVLNEIISDGAIPIILGGSQDLTYANYCTYEQLNQVINIVSIDAKFDIGNEDKKFKSNSYFHKIILKQPNYLFNYSNIGYQSYMVDKDEVVLMDKLYFDAYRLGIVQEDPIDFEPVIRNADILSLDMNAIRFSDSPGCKHTGPNGFTGKEICQLVRYAGGSHKLSSFGIYEYNPSYDIMSQSAKLIAQIIWYFIDGYIMRQNDAPDIIKKNYYKYFVSLHADAYEIVFYKSKISNLWWMEIPAEAKNPQYSRHYLIPCSLKDYEKACNDEIPERWLQTYKKIKIN